MKKSIFTLCMLILTVITTQAQIRTPQPSPLATMTQKVGLTDIEVEYSRPSVKGRNIFGGLVPYGNIWRTGANASTKITFSDDVTIAEKAIKKGTYALYVIPNDGEWTFIIHSNTSHWGVGGKDYKESEDVIRFTVKTQEIKPIVESFTIGFSNLKANSADVNLSWENTMASFTIYVDTDTKVMADIKKVLGGTPPAEYYKAARYYYDSGKDKEQALEWVSQAIENGYNGFWVYRLKSLIEADLGSYKTAIKTAKKSLAAAEKAGNQDYVRMNTKSIAEWTKKR